VDPLELGGFHRRLPTHRHPAHLRPDGDGNGGPQPDHLPGHLPHPGQRPHQSARLEGRQAGTRSATTGRSGAGTPDRVHTGPPGHLEVSVRKTQFLTIIFFGKP